jgi:diguanylate cyclase (GGDEF)-like protein/PAS domain S-box-containing protein
VTSITIPKDLLALLAGHLVWLEDSKHKIVFWSVECATMFGYSPQQILGKPASLICPDPDGDCRMLADGRKITVSSVTLQLRDGSDLLTCHLDIPQAVPPDWIQYLPLPAVLLDASSVLSSNTHWQQLACEWIPPCTNTEEWLLERFPPDFSNFLSRPERCAGKSWIGSLKKADEKICQVEIWLQSTPQGQLLIANNISEQSQQIDELIDENQRVRLALASTHLGIWDWHTGLDIVQFSPELNQMLGFPGHWSENNFDGFLDIFVEDEHKQILDYLESHLSVGTPFDLTCRIKSRSGEVRWTRLCGQCLRDPKGNPVRMSGSLSDISDYKQTIDALRSSDTQLSTAQHVARLGNWEWSIADNSMYWSEAMYALHGLPSSRIQPDLETYIRLVYAPDQVELRQALLKAIKTRDEISAEYRVTHRDGRLIDIWLTCYPHISAHGELKSLFGTAQDISERKRVERQIAGEKKILEMIAGSRELSESLGTLCRVIEEQLNGAMASIQLLDEHSGQLYYIAASSLPLEFIQGSQNWPATPYSGSCAATVSLRRSIISEDIGADSVWTYVRYLALNNGLLACWATPLQAKDGRIIGTLGIYFRARRSANDFEKSLLERMGRLAGIAIENHTVEAALKQSEERWHFALEGSQDGVWDWRLDNREAYYSKRYEQILGLGDEERLDTQLDNWSRQIHADDLQRIEGELQRYLGGEGEFFGCEYRITTPQGSTRWVLARGKIINRSENGEPTRVIGTLTDISASKQAEETLRLNAQVFESAGEGIVITDRFNRIISVNRAFTRITGFGESEALGKDPKLLASGQHDTAFYRTMWGELGQHDYWQGEIWNRRKNGEQFPEWLTISTVRRPNGEIANYIATFSDISESKKQTEHIQFLANFDTLTNLPNRLLFRDRVELAIASAQRTNSMLAVLFIDLDRFKTINDSLGHHVGDRLLQEMASRISSVLTEADTAARVGGDEFILLLNDLRQPQDVAPITSRLLELIGQTARIDGNELRLTPSIGIAIFPQDGRDYDSLVKHADAAMYHAKDKGRNNYQFFTADLNVRMLEQLQLENALRRALEHDELMVHFQPQYNVHTGQIIGAEALLRWRHNELGMISPARFIPIAEDSGLIFKISDRVIKATCQHISDWQTLGLSVPAIAINISANQFRQHDFALRIVEILSAYGISPAQIELELTESILMQDIDIAIANMQQLRASGFKLSIDDFGTGYSSLSYLKRFPIDKLKIDQSFVREIPGDDDSSAITGAIISLAHSLQLKVIAEGVETKEQLDFLLQKGCDEVQGYYFSKPLAANDFQLKLSKPLR